MFHRVKQFILSHLTEGLVILLCLFAVAALFKVTLSDIQNREKEMISQRQQYLQTIADREAKSFIGSIAHMQRELELLASHPLVISRTANKIQGSQLKKNNFSPMNFALGHEGELASSNYRLDSNGIVLARYPFKKEREGADFSKKEGVRHVLKSHHAYISPLFFSKSGEQCFTLLVPVFDQGKFVGILRSLIYLETIHEVMALVKVGEKGYIQIIDAQGRVLSHPKLSHHGKDMLLLRKEKYPNYDWNHFAKILNRMKKGERGGGIYYSIWWNDSKPMRIKKVTAFTPILFGSHKWSLGLTIESDDIAASLYQQEKKLLIAVVMITLLFTGLVIYLLMSRRGKNILQGKVESAQDLERVNQELSAEMENHEKTYRQLLQSQKLDSIGTLAGGIAHDFNNLNGGMLAYACMLKNEFEDNPKAVKKLNIIIQSSERAAELTSQLLGFARQGTHEKKPVRLNATVIEVKNLLSRTIDKTISVQTKLDSKLWRIEGDPTQIMQVVMNLGVNAKDAMPQGGELTFATENLIADQAYCDAHQRIKLGNYVHVTVSDTGTGILKSVMDKIFDPFFTTKEIGKGTGLGLSMIFGIMKSHEGEVTVYSEEGKGSVFHLYFPAIDKKESKENKSLSSGDLKNVKIKGTFLVVDDDKVMRGLALDSFEGTDAKCILAENGQEALKLLAENQGKIDLVILDIIMPVMDGIQVYQEMIQKYPQLKVLFSSGYIESDKIISFRKAKPKLTGFIHKPFRKTDLIREILRLI